MKGGHAGSGPLRDPNAIRRERRDDAVGVVHLPAAGRPGPAPAWPLPRPTRRELATWSRVWALPQAVEWERLNLGDQVAMYVRSFDEAGVRGAPASLRTLVKQQEEVLGLSEPGLVRRRWVIDSDSPAPKVTKADDPVRTSARARFKTLDGGVAS